MTDKPPSVAESDAVEIDKARLEFERKCGITASAWITGNADAAQTVNFLLADFICLRTVVYEIRSRT